MELSKELYSYIFKETYGFDCTSLNEQNAYNIRNAIRILRRSYRTNNNFPTTDYSANDMRKAYMLAYYPYYFVPIYKVTEEYILPILSKVENKRLNITFLASGAGPEVYGLLTAIDEAGLNKKVQLNMLDYERAWEIQRKTTFQLLNKSLVNLAILPISNVAGCDLQKSCGNSCSNSNNCTEKQLRSDIIVMENCLNHMYDEDNFINSMLFKFKSMKSGALFVIMDLKDMHSLKLINKIIDNSSKYMELITPRPPQYLKEVSKVDTGIQIPDEVKHFIFNGDEDLIAKKNVSFIYTVLKRV